MPIAKKKGGEDLTAGKEVQERHLKTIGNLRKDRKFKSLISLKKELKREMILRQKNLKKINQWAYLKANVYLDCLRT